MYQAPGLAMESRKHGIQTRVPLPHEAAPTMLSRIVKTGHRGLASRCRLAPVICSMLVLWSVVDSQFFLLIGAETPRPPISSPLSCPDDPDDDEMIELTRPAASFRTDSRMDPLSLPQDLRKANFSSLFSRRVSGLSVLAVVAWGRHGKDDFETPLRC